MPRDPDLRRSAHRPRLKAAQVGQDLVERLVPTADDRPAFRAGLHTAAQTLQRALENGRLDPTNVVTALVTATAPPVPRVPRLSRGGPSS